MKTFIISILAAAILLQIQPVNSQNNTLSGKLVLMDKDTEAPLLRSRVLVMHFEDTLAQGFTDANGVFSFTSKDPTGISNPDKISEPVLFIAPNPVTGTEIYVNYHSAGSLDKPAIDIYNSSGKYLSKNDYFVPGSYFVQVRDGYTRVGTAAQFLITIPGFFTFHLKNQFEGEAGKKATKDEGTPLAVYAEKFGYISFSDIVYFPVDPTEVPLNLEKAPIPLADFSFKGSVIVGGIVYFDGTTSSGANAEVLDYTWDFGDGNIGSGQKISHTYMKVGEVKVTLTAIGAYGAMATLQKTLTVSPAGTPSDTAIVTAIVKTVGKEPIPDVKISVNGIDEIFTTDNLGFASLKVPVKMPVTISLYKSGYATQSQHIKLKAGSKFGDHYFTLVPRENSVKIDEVEFGFDYTSQNGTRVSIPVDGLVDELNNFVTGSIDLSLTPVNVSDREEIKAFPGEFAGITPEGEAPVILSHGVAEYIFEKNGKKLQLSKGKFADIEIPVSIATNMDGSKLLVGDTSPLWSLNEQTGIWVQEGEGTVVANNSSPTGLALKGRVGHFSWWNHDIAPNPYRPIPECKIIDKYGLPTLDIPQGGACYLEGEIAGPNGPRSRPTTMGSGTPLPLPPDVDIWIIASGQNGLYSGKKKVNGKAGVVETVIIPMTRVYEGGNGDLISADTLFDASIEDSTDLDSYTFEVTAGTTYYLGIGRAINSTLTGKISLFNGTMNHLASGTFNDKGFTFTFMAEETGTYTITIGGTANYPGAYRLLLEEIPLVTLNNSYVVNTFFTGQQKMLAFNAKKGQVIYPYTNTTNGHYYNVKINDPNGTSVLNSKSTYTNNPGYYEVVADGLYTYEIETTSRENVTYQLGLSTIEEPIEFQKGEISTITDSIGIFGKPVFMKFNGSKGEVINYGIWVEDSLSAYYTLYKPGTEEFYKRELLRQDDVVNFNGSASSTPYNDVYTLPEDGEYIFQVQAGRTSGKEDFTGKLTFRLFRPEAKEVEYNKVYTDSIAIPFNLKRYSLKLNKPGSISIEYTNRVKGGYLYLRLYDKTGKFITETRSNVLTGSISYGEISGVYVDSIVYIEFNPSGIGYGGYDFNVVENQDPISLSSAVPWTEISGEISQNGEVDYYRFDAEIGQIVGLSYIRDDNSSLEGNFSVYKMGLSFNAGTYINDLHYSTSSKDVNGKYGQITAEIPESGEYIIRVDGRFTGNSSDKSTGSYKLRFNILDKAANIIVDDVNNNNPLATTGFISSAIRASNEGGTIQIEAGDYFEPASIIVKYDNLSITGADSANTHVELGDYFDVYSNQFSVRKLHFINNRYRAIYLQRNTKDFLLENVRITGSGEAVEGYGGNSSLIIRNNSFLLSGGSIISLSGDDMLVENNRLNLDGGNSNSGIRVSGNGNIIRNNSIGSPEKRTVQMAAIDVTGDSALIEGNLLNTFTTGIAVNNSQNDPGNIVTIRDNSFGSFTGANGGVSDGIVVGFVKDAQVFNNNFIGYSNLSRAMRLRETGGTIYNNRIRNSGMGIYIDTKDASPELLIINNTIVKSESSNSQANIYVINTGSLAPVRIYNNILTMPATTSADRYGIYSQTALAGYSNNLFNGHAAKYSANLTPGANDVTGDPLLSEDGLKLGSGSPAINAGISTNAPLVDFEGTSRPQGAGVDIGADEYSQ